LQRREVFRASPPAGEMTTKNCKFPKDGGAARI
jgi:hypothetical protein